MERGMRDFVEFCNNMELEDLPMLGRKYTWTNYQDQAILSRLDRFLMSHQWIQQFKVLQWGLERPISDHCLVVIMDDNRDWGPRPVKFMDIWLSHPDYMRLAKESWENTLMFGWAGFKLVQKLKAVKERLNVWNKKEFGDVNLALQVIEAEFHQFDLLAEDRQLSPIEKAAKCKANSEFWRLSRLTESLWRQKSRIKWFKEGDKNTRFFQVVANNRYKRDVVGSINVSGRVVEDPSEFEEGEIVVALKDCSNIKAPGPNGFNFSFVKKGWDFMKNLVLLFFSKFHANGKLTKGINSTFVSLIPKVDCPLIFKDFRPISMVGCVYKLMSKVLANRIKAHLPLVIGESQAAFIGGKQILDGVLVANEVIHSWKTRNIGGLILKIDFERAYDCVNWEFLLDLLSKLGFRVNWCRWIKECCSSVSMSVLINGSASKEFTTQKGLRQGDPLSPFLFNIVVEALNIMLERARARNIIKRVKVGANGVVVSHLQFANDTILFCNNDREELANIKRILRCFQLMSGLKINFSKSSLCGVNIPQVDVSSLAQVMGCKIESLPIKYLGLPLGANSRRTKTWKPVLEKMEKRLNVWTRRTNSTGGRLTLINSSFSNLPTYFMSIFKIPVAVVKVIKGKYNLVQGACLPNLPRNGRITNIWRDICSLKDPSSSIGLVLNEGFRIQVHSGTETSFWEHVWLRDRPLKEEFPRLFLISSQKESSVRSVKEGSGIMLWKLQYRKRRLNVMETNLSEELHRRLALVTLDQTKRDVLQWKWIDDKRFSSRSVYRQWEQMLQSRNQVLGSLWKNLCPPKVEIFSWIAIQDRTPTRSLLSNRNIVQEGQSVSYPLCSLHVETPEHLFLYCQFSWNTWSFIMDWWHMSWVCPKLISDLALWWFDIGFRNLEKNVWEATFYATLWSLWLVRNDYVFNSATTSFEVVGDLVKTRVAMWMKTKFTIKIYSVEEFKVFLDGIHKLKL
ncbi:uncharacterized protein LOC131323632 [Rhododendron vialii]|uniref:uncharacterized protein LOC131323632 n=1 Tax=Rhododendron vialii TaxID=182163 RepID=UPI00265E202F|nr:uncharacterized protein LOC131323632 [Rhododendron vialii]